MKLLVFAGALTLVAAVAPAAEKKGNIAKGKEIFSQQCMICHTTTAEKKVGPGMKGLYKRDKLVTGKKPSDASVRARIDEGGNGMPAYRDLLSDEEKVDLIAYLKTL